MAEQNTLPQRKIGTVVSNSMNKTIIVQTQRKVKDPIYGKYIRRFSKMAVHDNDNKCSIGDVVLIKQSRPISKTKHWVLVEILEHSEKEAVL